MMTAVAIILFIAILAFFVFFWRRNYKNQCTDDCMYCNLEKRKRNGKLQSENTRDLLKRD